ncbi:SH3 domain-containing protein 2-like [Hibiscus syriacus]|uniref:SH3 domain-containing protein 2-like n=1 Tax=Hibiscus syriacus TaxID=106335 RepID=UPI00192147E4|nr:SH3 domain-containing protein 2-like [Hibiscus syriacus]
MVMGAPSEDTRHLAQRYDRMRREAEAQAIEVSKRQARVRETLGNPENVMKLKSAETKLQDLKSNMAILGKEATVAMTTVEAQQQRLTLQRLIAMVEASVSEGINPKPVLQNQGANHDAEQESHCGKLHVRAVATLEPKCLIPKQDGLNNKLQLFGDSSPSSTQPEPLEIGD